jgi:O-antigen biosynthesis protein
MPSAPEPLRTSPVRLPLDGRAPVLAGIIDLAGPLPAVGGDGRYGSARCLVVLRGSPIGWVHLRLLDGAATPEEVAEVVWASLRREIVAALARAGKSAPGSLPVEGYDLGPEPDRQVDPRITVVVATRERPDQLEPCLRSILHGITVPEKVIVVDNAPETDTTQRLVQRMSHDHPSLEYLRERRPGLGRAHNAALPHVATRLVAFTDDDVVVHQWWLSRTVEAFDAGDDVVCVTGMIAPLELDTATQQLIESHAGFNKGFVRRLFDPEGDNSRNVLFPFAAGVFGSGANMAFDTDYLRGAGGFDEALGAGTIALGGDDLAAFYDVMAHGHQLVYEPAAVVSHRHHRDPESLERQAYGYGAGLSAHLTRCVVNDPRTVLAMAKRLPPALRRVASIARPSDAQVAPARPRSLTLQHVRGMAAGPARYVRSRRAARSAGSSLARPVTST